MSAKPTTREVEDWTLENLEVCHWLARAGSTSYPPLAQVMVEQDSIASLGSSTCELLRHHFDQLRRKHGRKAGFPFHAREQSSAWSWLNLEVW